MLYFGYCLYLYNSVVLPESGFALFWALSISCGQHTCADSLNICIQTFCVVGH